LSSSGLEVKMLLYTPKTNMWFFVATDTMPFVPKYIQNIYWKTKRVCYTYYWFHCQSREAIPD
ncbi:hypothetical protein KR054_003462, partial [Drosophila jambulina]